MGVLIWISKVLFWDRDAPGYASQCAELEGFWCFVVAVLAVILYLIYWLTRAIFWDRDASQYSKEVAKLEAR